MRVHQQAEIIKEFKEGDTIFVNAYTVTRHCGGPEEGGWWYNAGCPLASVPVQSVKEAIKTKYKLRKQFADEERGDIYSVLGGVLLEVYYEEEFAEYWPSGRPQYC